MNPITTLADLQAWPHWIVFDREPQPDGKKPKKVPYTPGTNHRAKVNDPATWRPYAEAVADGERTGRVPGIALTPEMHLSLIDIDGQAEHALVAELDSCTERSINGGLHIFVRGRPPAGFVAPAGVEVYPRDGNRFVLITGNLVDGRDIIQERTEALARCFPPRPTPTCPDVGTIDANDQTIIERVRGMTKGRQLFDAGDISLYGDDHSRADLGLLNCFVSAGAVGSDQLDRLFRESALMRDKWERRDYRERSIAEALDGTVVPFEGYQRAIPISRSHSVPPATTPPSPSTSPADRIADLEQLLAQREGDVARLRAALDTCCADRAELRRQNAELRAERDQARRDLAVVIKTLDNPNLGGDAAGKALILAAAEVQHRSHTVPPSDGYVQVNATRVADNREWVTNDAGERVPVSAPARISPRTVTKYIGLAAEAGLIDAKKDEIPAPVDKPTIKNEGWYWKVAPTLADQLAPLATGSVYSDDNPRPLRGGDPAKRRRLRTLPGCPDCGGHHVACATCGTLYETPAAVDLDSGQTLSVTEMPPDDGVVPPTVVDGITVDKFADERRAHTVPPKQRASRERAAADLARREPAWLRDAPDPWDAPPQPSLFPLDDLPPGQSHHFSADRLGDADG
jgi:hypothetical protein